MSKIKWNQTGENKYETGLDQGVLFPTTVDGTYGPGVAWNGLTAVSEAPSGAEATPVYADNKKYITLQSAEELGLTIEAYMSPEEFDVCDGTVSPSEGVTLYQQERRAFGMAYRTKIGNDVAGQDLGYKIHLIWGALAAPSERAHATINESPEAMTLSWECTTTAVPVTGFKPTARMTIDSTQADAADLAAFEAILYGTDAAGEATAIAPRLPLPDEIITLFAAP